MALKIDPGLEKDENSKFTIQPLVENYFAHGVDHKRWDNVISVKVLQGEGQVMILVSDNGRGMEEEQLEKNSRDTSQSQSSLRNRRKEWPAVHRNCQCP